MKSTAWLLIIGFFALVAGDALAQEANMPLSVEAGSDQFRRTPALVVHEIAATSSTVKPAGTEANKPEAAEAKKTASRSAAVAVSTIIQIPKPLVLPTGSTPIVEMGTTGNPKYDEFVAQSAARNAVDPNLILAVMRQESGFNQRARSYRG